MAFPTLPDLRSEVSVDQPESAPVESEAQPVPARPEASHLAQALASRLAAISDAIRTFRRTPIDPILAWITHADAAERRNEMFVEFVADAASGALTRRERALMLLAAIGMLALDRILEGPAMKRPDNLAALDQAAEQLQAHPALCALHVQVRASNFDPDIEFARLLGEAQEVAVLQAPSTAAGLPTTVAAAAQAPPAPAVAPNRCLELDEDGRHVCLGRARLVYRRRGIKSQMTIQHAGVRLLVAIIRGRTQDPGQGTPASELRSALDEAGGVTLTFVRSAGLYRVVPELHLGPRLRAHLLEAQGQRTA